MSEGGDEPTTGSSATAPAEAPLPLETVLVAAAAIAALLAGLVVTGALRGWTPPTLAVVFSAGLVEGLVAAALAVRVLLADEKRLGLFVPGVVLAGLALASLVGVFLLSGAI